MAEEHNGEKTEVQAGKNKSSSLIIIVIVLFVLILIGGGAAGYFLFLAPNDGAQASPAQQTPAVQSDAGSAAGSAAGFTGPLKPLDSFIVNLTDAQGTRYLKVVMQLEMSNEILGTEIDRKTPQIRDEIIMLLSSKSFEDVSSVAGKRALKRGILNTLNRYLTTGRVNNVYFSEFVVQ